MKNIYSLFKGERQMLRTSKLWLVGKMLEKLQKKENFSMLFREKYEVIFSLRVLKVLGA